MAKKKSTVAVVFGILQIVFGSLGLLSAVLYFAGAQQAIAAWQSGMVKGGPGPQPMTQEQLMAEVTKRLPWYHAFEAGTNSANLVLSLMMVIGGIGLLQMQRWAHRLTIAYALLSILYTATATTLMIGYIGPVMGDVMGDAMKAQVKGMPGGPGRGGPDPEALAAVMRVAMTFGAVCGASLAIYPLLVLIFMSLKSVRAAFSGVPLPAESEDYDDRYRDEDERGPSDRYPPDDATEPDDRFRPGDR
jgi:hypothetical protein